MQNLLKKSNRKQFFVKKIPKGGLRNGALEWPGEQRTAAGPARRFRLEETLIHARFPRRMDVPRFSVPIRHGKSWLRETASSDSV
jgi:hypothetical protein